MKILITAALLLNMSLALAQDKSLILETDPTETTIPLVGTASILTNGDLRVTPADPSACQASNSCEDVVVDVQSFAASNASANVVTVSEGGSFTVSWSSLGATECRGIGTYPDWSERTNLATDSRLVVDATVLDIVTSSGDAAASPYTLGIQCANGSVSDSLSGELTLIVDEVVEPSPTSCEGREPISGWTRLTTGNLSCRESSGLDTTADCRNWSPDLWANPFLSSGGLSEGILTNVSAKRQYVAIKFDTNGMEPTASGRFNTESPGAAINSEKLLATISQCPGDFNPNQVTGCYLSPGVFTPFNWRGPNSSSSSNCVLQPDTTYYLNILSTNSPLGTSPDSIEPVDACDDNKCGVLLTPRF